jgi:hypothetical protein
MLLLEENKKNKWSDEKHEVENIEISHGQKFYKISGYTRPYVMRHGTIRVT